MKKIIAALAAIMMFVPAFSLAEEAGLPQQMNPPRWPRPKPWRMRLATS